MYFKNVRPFTRMTDICAHIPNSLIVNRNIIQLYTRAKYCNVSLKLLLLGHKNGNSNLENCFMHSVDQIDTGNDISGHIYCTEPDDLLKI